MHRRNFGWTAAGAMVAAYWLKPMLDAQTKTPQVDGMIYCTLGCTGGRDWICASGMDAAMGSRSKGERPRA